MVGDYFAATTCDRTPKGVADTDRSHAVATGTSTPKGRASPVRRQSSSAAAPGASPKPRPQHFNISDGEEEDGIDDLMTQAVASIRKADSSL